MGFLQKYYHKGAFHQDDELLKRDYTMATENAVDMTSLPAVMQVRDFGKVGSMVHVMYCLLIDSVHVPNIRTWWTRILPLEGGAKLISHLHLDKLNKEDSSHKDVGTVAEIICAKVRNLVPLQAY